jgi:predicted glycoside hydrolase/deacetylase ChbG (UPF0249 family)
MTPVLFNADDFGLTAGVTRGIVESRERGVVGSTTAMVCRGHDALLREWAPRLAGRIGLHLQLSDGMPSLPPEEVPSLVDTAGRFPRKLDRPERLAREEVAREWRAQMEKLRSLGIEPTHLDSHHHVHQHETVLPVYAELALELGLPVRSGFARTAQYLRRAGVRCPVVCDTSLASGAVSVERLLRSLRAHRRSHRSELIEVMCHPGYVCDQLLQVSTATHQRFAELTMCCSDELRTALDKARFVPVGPADAFGADNGRRPRVTPIA